MDRLKVISVIALEKYKIQVQFNDSTEGVLDLSSHAGKGVFKAWDTDDNFSKVHINSQSGAITWPDDLDIDTLNTYFIIKGITPEQYFQTQKKYAQH